MRLEFFDDASIPRPVLLLWGTDLAEATLLWRAVDELANATRDQLRVDGLPGHVAVDGCSLLARVGDVNRGVQHVRGSDRAFVCELDRAGWRYVWKQLEGFLAHQGAIDPNGFHYLDESGPIEWVISGHRGW